VVGWLTDSAHANLLGFPPQYLCERHPLHAPRFPPQGLYFRPRKATAGETSITDRSSFCRWVLYRPLLDRSRVIPYVFFELIRIMELCIFLFIRVHHVFLFFYCIPIAVNSLGWQSFIIY
jgi:hypothetical protein